MEQKIERFNAKIDTGLTDEQIQKRIEENLVNYDSSVPTKSFKQIIFDNFFTLIKFSFRYCNICCWILQKYAIFRNNDYQYLH